MEPDAPTPVQRASREADRELHMRLLAGDPTAPSDLIVTHLKPLVRRLRQRFSRVDPHVLEEAAGEVLFQLVERPEQYDPERAPLAGYLHLAARRDVLNELRREQRWGNVVPLEDVELGLRAGNVLVGAGEDPADVVIRRQPAAPELLELIHENFDATERRFLQLRLDGERRTAVFARVLGIEDQSELEQAREVKRVKDRLDKRLRRLAPWVYRDA